MFPDMGPPTGGPVIELIFPDIAFRDIAFRDIAFPDIAFPDITFPDIGFPGIWFDMFPPIGLGIGCDIGCAIVFPFILRDRANRSPAMC